MCRVPGCTTPPGGGRLAASWTTLCNHHRQRERRHGDAFQQPIRAAHLAPYLRSLQRRQKLRPDAAAWGALADRWEGLVRACRDTLAVYATGTPGNRWEVEAAGEIVKVAGQATAEAAWQVAVAMFLMREADAHRFTTEGSFRVQLGRRVRHLADTNRGSYWHPGEGRFKLVFRDPSPRAAVLVGDILTETFGVAGIYFAKQAAAEADAKAAERRAFHNALNEVAPGVAGAADAAGVAG